MTSSISRLSELLKAIKLRKAFIERINVIPAQAGIQGDLGPSLRWDDGLVAY